MFDTTREIAFDAALASTGGLPHPVVLRFPTDQEWSLRTRSRKFIIHRQGRGTSETIPPAPSDADVKLYQAISLNGNPAMTAAEAARVLDMMAACDVTDVRIEGNRAAVDMSIFSEEEPVHHRVRIPTADQVRVFREGAARHITLPYNKEELRFNPDAGAQLYDQCGGHSADYEGGLVPNLHKHEVIKAVINHVDMNLGPRKSDANF